MTTITSISQQTTTPANVQPNATKWRDREVSKFQEGMGPIKLDGLGTMISSVLIALATITAAFITHLATASLATTAIVGGTVLGISALTALFLSRAN